MVYYVVFHKNLPENYGGFTAQEMREYFAFLGVNEGIEKNFDRKGKIVVMEYDLPYYNPLYQANRFYQNSAFFTIGRNPQMLIGKHIGWGQYDQTIDAPSFKEALWNLERNPTAVAGACRYTVRDCLDVLSVADWNEVLLKPLNKFSNVPTIMADLDQYPILLMHTFILPVEIWKRMIDFVERVVLKNLCRLLKNDMTHIAGSLERAFGLYLAYQMHKRQISEVFFYKVTDNREQTAENS